ncbi:hypothetical protein GCM10010377_72020 [Streptomyces viridiviolaceus]|nr:hypothetical protein GCM10010377_72020 [Streptomyces viridiviolaceus]
MSRDTRRSSRWPGKAPRGAKHGLLGAVRPDPAGEPVRRYVPHGLPDGLTARGRATVPHRANARSVERVRLPPAGLPPSIPVLAFAVLAPHIATVAMSRARRTEQRPREDTTSDAVLVTGTDRS